MDNKPTFEKIKERIAQNSFPNISHSSEMKLALELICNEIDSIKNISNGIIEKIKSPQSNREDTCYYIKGDFGDYISGCFEIPFPVVSDVSQFTYCPFCGKAIRIDKD